MIFHHDLVPSASVQEFEVFNMLKKTKAGKAGSTDGISLCIILEFGFDLSKPLIDLKDVVPTKRKRAVVVPKSQEKAR